MCFVCSFSLGGGVQCTPTEINVTEVYLDCTSHISPPVNSVFLLDLLDDIDELTISSSNYSK